MNAKELLENYLSQKDKVVIPMDLGKCYANNSYFDIMINAFNKNWEKYGGPYEKTVVKKNKERTYNHETFSPERGLSVHRVTTRDNKSGDIIYMEVVSCNTNNGECCYDTFYVEEEPKFAHFESQITPYGRIITKNKKAYLTNTNNDLSSAIEYADSVAKKVREVGGKVITKTEKVQDIEELEREELQELESQELN